MPLQKQTHIWIPRYIEKETFQTRTWTPRCIESETGMNQSRHQMCETKGRAGVEEIFGDDLSETPDRVNPVYHLVPSNVQKPLNEASHCLQDFVP